MTLFCSTYLQTPDINLGLDFQCDAGNHLIGWWGIDIREDSENPEAVSPGSWQGGGPALVVGPQRPRQDVSQDLTIVTPHVTFLPFPVESSKGFEQMTNCNVLEFGNRIKADWMIVLIGFQGLSLIFSLSYEQFVLANLSNHATNSDFLYFNISCSLSLSYHWFQYHKFRTG